MTCKKGSAQVVVQFETGELEMKNGKLETKNGKLETKNGQLETGRKILGSSFSAIYSHFRVARFSFRKKCCQIALQRVRRQRLDTAETICGDPQAISNLT
jgi:hypothetical protein